LGVIRVRIESLVLHGFGGIDGAAVGSSLQEALANSLARQRSEGWHAVRRDGVDAGTVRAAASPAALGRAVARGVARELGR
jgi:hypothetical protein